MLTHCSVLILASEMDQSVKRMLKLIDEDGDSFAKKAEMYYKKRPELVASVEEFYRMYRALAERYDQVTGELRNSIPSDIRSQGSGTSEFGSEPPSSFPSPEWRKRRPNSGHRAAGFAFFLGSGPDGSNNSEQQIREDDSSLYSSESESEGSSINNYSGSVIDGDDNELRRKISDLESELGEVKQKLNLYQVDNTDGYYPNGNAESLVRKVAEYEERLRQSYLKIQVSEEELVGLRKQLQKYEAMDYTHEPQATELDIPAQENIESIFGSERDVHSPEPELTLTITSPEDELRLAKQRLHGIHRGNYSTRHELDRLRSLPDLSHWEQRLEVAQKDIAEWKSKFNLESREVSKLQERISRYKASLSEREQEVRELRNSISDTDRKHAQEILELQDKIAQLVNDQFQLEEKLKASETSCHRLEDEIKQFEYQKAELIDLYIAKEKAQSAELEHLRVDITDRNTQIHGLNGRLAASKQTQSELLSEKNKLQEKLAKLEAETDTKVEEIKQMNKHLDTLHIEHMNLITKADEADKATDIMKERVTELENEIKVQRKMVAEGAEEKREAIRQLCLSIEHYRNSYHTLREAFVGSKYKVRTTVLAA